MIGHGSRLDAARDTAKRRAWGVILSLPFATENQAAVFSPCGARSARAPSARRL